MAPLDENLGGVKSSSDICLRSLAPDGLVYIGKRYSSVRTVVHEGSHNICRQVEVWSNGSRFLNRFYSSADGINIRKYALTHVDREISFKHLTIHDMKSNLSEGSGGASAYRKSAERFRVHQYTTCVLANRLVSRNQRACVCLR